MHDTEKLEKNIREKETIGNCYYTLENWILSANLPIETKAAMAWGALRVARDIGYWTFDEIQQVFGHLIVMLLDLDF